MSYALLCLLLWPLLTLSQVHFYSASPSSLAAGQWPEYMELVFSVETAVPVGGTVSVGVISSSGFSIFDTAASNQPVVMWVLTSTAEQVLADSCAAATASWTSSTAALTVTLNGACTAPANSEIHLKLPWSVLLPNPPRQTMVVLDLATSVPNQGLVTVQVPYYVTDTLIPLQGLQYFYAMPSSPLVNTKLTSLTISFTPSVGLQGNVDSIGLFVSESILAVPSTSPYPTVVIGGCTATTVDVNTENAGVTAIFHLQPDGCALQGGTNYQVAIPQSFLGSNPVAASSTVYSKLWTSAEPTLQNVQTPYVTGTSAPVLTSVTASNLLPSANPGPLTVTMTLKSAMALTTDKIYVGASPGVFIPLQTGVPITAVQPAACTAMTASTTTVNSQFAIAEHDVMTINLGTNGCVAALSAGAKAILQIPSSALLPNYVIGTAPYFTLSTTRDLGTVWLNPGYTVSKGLGPPSNLYSPTNAFDTNKRPASLTSYIMASSPSTSGSTSSANNATTYWKYSNAAQKGAVSDTVTINNWGNIVTVPMLAVTSSYPNTTSSLTTLGLPSATCSPAKVAWIFSVDRFSSTGQPYNIQNPLHFLVTRSPTLSQLLLFTAAGTTGTDLNALDSSAWAQTSDTVLAMSASSGVFVGCAYDQSTTGSTGNGSSSNDAWLGFLAFLVIPVLCFIACCVGAALFAKKRMSRAEGQPMPMQQSYPMPQSYPVVETATFMAFPAPYFPAPYFPAETGTPPQYWDVDQFARPSLAPRPVLDAGYVAPVATIDARPPLGLRPGLDGFGMPLGSPLGMRPGLDAGFGMMSDAPLGLGSGLDASFGAPLSGRTIW